MRLCLVCYLLLIIAAVAHSSSFCEQYVFTTIAVMLRNSPWVATVNYCKEMKNLIIACRFPFYIPPNMSSLGLVVVKGTTESYEGAVESLSKA